MNDIHKFYTRHVHRKNLSFYFLYITTCTKIFNTKNFATTMYKYMTVVNRKLGVGKSLLPSWCGY